MEQMNLQDKHKWRDLKQILVEDLLTGYKGQKLSTKRAFKRNRMKLSLKALMAEEQGRTLEDVDL